MNRVEVYRYDNNYFTKLLGKSRYIWDTASCYLIVTTYLRSPNSSPQYCLYLWRGGASTLTLDEGLQVLDRIVLLCWEPVRYLERAVGSEDQTRRWRDVRVFPTQKAFAHPLADSQLVPEKSVLLRSFVRQDNEPEHLLLQMRGKLVVLTSDLEERKAAPAALYHLFGQPKVSQVAREVPATMASLASKGAFLCIAKDQAPTLWVGQLYISYNNSFLKLQDAGSMIGRSLYKKLLRIYYKEKGLPCPKQLPEVRIAIEGKESRDALASLGDAVFIKNDVQYRKEALDARDSLYYTSNGILAPSFEGDYRSHTLVNLDDAVTLIDTNRELFVIPGKKLTGEDRRAKCKTAVKTFLVAKKAAQGGKGISKRVAITYFNLSAKVYAAMKYLAV